MSDTMVHVGVLVPLPKREPLPPEAQPLGRGALNLRDEGIEAVFGAEVVDGELVGTVARPGRWEPVRRRVDAVFDRFPSRLDETAHEALVSELRPHTGPIANDLTVIHTCRDKIRAQELLVAAGVPMPQIVTAPEAFADTLSDWGTAFLKPRYGACGKGIVRVSPGDPLPSEVESTLVGVPEPTFLQRAVTPPDGWAGVSVRVLAQREGEDWVLNPGVARRSREDWVVSASRGAELAAAEDWLTADGLCRMREVVRGAAEALAEVGGNGIVEVGVDVMIDADQRPWVIEVNSRPWGRVRGLAERDSRFAEAHEAACRRPLRWLAGRV